MRSILGVRLREAALLGTALCFCTSMCAQGRGSTNNSNGEDEYPDLIELSAFGGVSLFGQVSAGLGEKLANGGTAGGRVAVNFTKYVGLEFNYNFMINNVRLVTPIKPGLWSYTFGNQIQSIALNPVFNMTPRGSRVQPYLTVGVGAMQFNPTKQAEDQARLPAIDSIYHSSNLNDNLQVAMNYGGGVKFHVSEHLGLRFDARGSYSRNPTFALPDYNDGGIYIPSHHHINGFTATMGLVFYFGQPHHPAPVAPPPPPPPAPLNGGGITGGEGTLCQGRPITLHSTASDPAGHQLNYAWKLNGAATGTNSPDFSFTPNNAGDFTVEVTVTDATNASRTVTAGPVTLNVKEYVEPQITSITAIPASISCAADTTGTHMSNLSGQATGSACGGNVTYKWTVSEGSVSNDTSANATFDASTLTFQGSQAQSKTITATLTVTDEMNKSASRTVDIAVNCPPQIVRLPDVVFAKNSPRVNNCGKRILIDEAAPRVAGGDYDIILVGHRAEDETATLGGTRRGRRTNSGRALDEQRTLNAAAVLTGNHGTCANVDMSHVKVEWVGTDQTSAPEPGLCGTSTRAAQAERKGAQVTEADRLRRVEVYLVPRNSQAMPPAVRNIKSLPEGEVRALGCPR